MKPWVMILFSVSVAGQVPLLAAGKGPAAASFVGAVVSVLGLVLEVEAGDRGFVAFDLPYDSPACFLLF